MKKILAVLLVALLAACTRTVREDPSQLERSMRQTVQVDLTVTGEIGDETQDVGVLGSGVVLAADDLVGRSIVVTASHVVDIHPPDNVKVVGVKVTVKSLSGRVCPAEVIYNDEPTDLALLYVFCVAGEPATIRFEPPSVGNLVYVVGAPKGWHPDGIFAATEGRVLGWEDGGAVVSSTVVMPGNSGGGLFYDGQLIGIVVRGWMGGYVSFSVPAWRVAEALGRGWDGRWSR